MTKLIVLLSLFLASGHAVAMSTISLKTALVSFYPDKQPLQVTFDQVQVAELKSCDSSVVYCPTSKKYMTIGSEKYELQVIFVPGGIGDLEHAVRIEMRFSNVVTQAKIFVNAWVDGTSARPTRLSCIFAKSAYEGTVTDWY